MKKECDIFISEAWFTLHHIQEAIDIAKCDGIDLATLRFTFNRRGDLSGNPFSLSFEGEASGEYAERYVFKTKDL